MRRAIVLAVIVVAGLLALRAWRVSGPAADTSGAERAVARAEGRLAAGDAELSAGPGAEPLRTPSDPVVVTLVDGESGAPVAGALVRVAERSAPRVGELRSDADGRVELARGDAVLLDVRAEGYVSWVGVVDGVTDERVRLRRGGRVELLVEGAAEAAALRAVLLPQRLEECTEAELLSARRRAAELEATLRGRADDGGRARAIDELRTRAELVALATSARPRSAGAGRVTWDGLPAGRYRYRLDTTWPCELDPPHEDQRIRFLDPYRFVDRGEGPPPGVSGAFEVTAGSTTALRATVRMPGLVEVRLALPLGERPAAVVRLFHVRDHRNELGQALLLANVEEGKAELSSSGTVRFEDVEPGRKRLRASWRIGDDVFFASHGFTLEPGEHRVVDRFERHVPGTGLVQVEAVLEAEDGRQLAPADLFDAPPVVEMTLNSGGSVPQDAGISTYLRVEPERPLRLHGLHAGAYDLVPTRHNPLWRSLRAPWAFLGGPLEPVSFEVPRAEPVRIVLPVDATTVLDLRVRAAGTQGRARLVSVRSGRAYLAFLDPSDPGELSGRLGVPAGDYELVIQAAGPEESWFSSERLTVPARRSLAVVRSPAPAVDVSGVLYAADGLRMPEWGVQASPEALWAADRPWLFAVPVDEEGRFTLRGVPPGCTLVFDTGDRVPVGPHGRDDVELRR